MRNFTTEEQKSAKWLDELSFTCDFCKSPFTRTKKVARSSDWLPIKQGGKGALHDFCNQACRAKMGRISTNCANCNKAVIKRTSEIKKSKNGNVFCTRSCSGTYNNEHKSYGTRRSKLEIWLEAVLPGLYPKLDFEFNSKKAINSELDIYIPKLNLAFELNGIFHYEPIYGQKTLNSTQNNDQKKFLNCHNANISLCIIDSSKQKKFTEKNSQLFLDIISQIIDQNLLIINERER